MKSPILVIIVFALLCIFATDSDAQRRRTRSKSTPKAPEIGQTATVIDETLSVLRDSPSLYAESIQRMRRGRKVRITGVKQVSGIVFFRVTAPPSSVGWVQADAVFGKFRTGDEERLARLVQASVGFDQIELAATFLEMHPTSKFRPPILLLFGDLIESTAAKLSKDAGKRLNRREMAASAAPVHSYYLNFVSLDRYRKLGAVFLFNEETRNFHYNGARWREILERFPASAEAAEAQKRIDSLNEKMERTAAN